MTINFFILRRGITIKAKIIKETLEKITHEINIFKRAHEVNVYLNYREERKVKINTRGKLESWISLQRVGSQAERTAIAT